MIKIADTSKLAQYDIIIGGVKGSHIPGGVNGSDTLVLLKGDFATIARMVKSHEAIDGMVYMEARTPNSQAIAVVYMMPIGVVRILNADHIRLTAFNMDTGIGMVFDLDSENVLSRHVPGSDENM